jgi:ribosomal protection tetracycline resistance protein
VTVLNLGIVAHVDAGKTSLTERLLYTGGVIDSVGSVDAGSTQTDSLDLERRRGITIKTAVASFPVGGVTVNLIDTPGHPDFIAEVERALRVLDGAVLVISAVEGVQAQTRVLMRTLRRLGLPTLIFVNKIDRPGAREASLLRDITTRLTDRAVAVSTVRDLGTRAATAHPIAGAVLRAADRTGPDLAGATSAGFDLAAAGLTDVDLTGAGGDFVARLIELAGDDDLLGDYVRGQVAYGSLRKVLTQRARTADLYPVFFGSAVTGAGVDALLDGVADLLPKAGGDPDAPLSGTVFKVERDRAGARIAYVRLFDGILRVRDHLAGGAVVTAIDVVEGGTPVRRHEVRAGEIGKIHGLREVRIGDPLGRPHERGAMRVFAPPTLETAIVPRRESDRAALHDALADLAEQDPLINLRPDLTVSLYGEVQKEVIEATLAEEYGIAVAFRRTTTIHVERPLSAGAAGETLREDGNPYFATLDLRVEPADGFAFVLDVPVEQVPIHVFKTVEFFRAALEETARRTLEQGLRGWPVIDVRVTATRTGFTSPLTTAADFRKLLPLVLMAALRAAGTVVCEPIQRFELDGPADTLGPVLGAVGRFGGVPERQEARGDAYIVVGLLPAARQRELEQALPGLTRGEGVVETTFAGYRPVAGPPPVRR